jgi:hypothetical protein
MIYEGNYGGSVEWSKVVEENTSSEELIHVDDVNSLDINSDNDSNENNKDNDVDNKVISTLESNDEKFNDWLKNQKIIHSEKINIEHTR